MYFLRGSLPWQGLKAATNKQKYEKIGEKKQTTAIKDLCEGYPEEFGIYLQYVRKLGFEESPDYDFLRGLFSKAIEKVGEQDDDIYDWMLLNSGKGWQTLSKRSGRQQNKKVVKDQTPKLDDHQPQRQEQQQQHQQQQQQQLQFQQKKSFWSKLACGLCQ